MSDITAVAGIGPATANVLAEHGIKTAAELAAATVESLVAIPGFSTSRAKTAIAAAKASLDAGVKTPAKSRSAKPKAAGAGAKISAAETDQADDTREASTSGEDVKSKKENGHKDEKKAKKHKKDKKDKKKDKKHKKHKKHKKDKKK